MKKFALAHTKWLADHQGNFTEEEMNYHLRMTSFLQHERAVHLPVMLISILALLLLTALCAYSPSIPALAGTIADFILALCYILHYYFLENTCQDWYRIYRDYQLASMSSADVD